MSNHLDDVILVDETDHAIGTQSKLSAHQMGLRHRAISVLISNSKGEILLQRRALGKYHSGGLWTNACCSHPRPGEDVLDAAHRRLSEEMGLTTALSPLFVTEYRAQVGDLIEHEIERFLNLQVGTSVVISGIEPTGSGWKNWIQADGRDLPFLTHEFDLVFSNAVIEHVGDKTDQNDFFRETDRVGRNWIVTTPNRLFPVESHTQVLFKHMNSNWKHSSFSRLLSKRDLLQIIPMGSRIIGRWFSPTFICYKSQN